jgi:hypothetical protein
LAEDKTKAWPDFNEEFSGNFGGVFRQNLRKRHTMDQRTAMISCPNCSSQATHTTQRISQSEPTMTDMLVGYGVVVLGVLTIPLCGVGLFLIPMGLAHAHQKGAMHTVNDSFCSACAFRWHW